MTATWFRETPESLRALAEEIALDKADGPTQQGD